MLALPNPHHCRLRTTTGSSSMASQSSCGTRCLLTFTQKTSCWQGLRRPAAALARRCAQQVKLLHHQHHDLVHVPPFLWFALARSDDQRLLRFVLTPMSGYCSSTAMWHVVALALTGGVSIDVFGIKLSREQGLPRQVQPGIGLLLDSYIELMGEVGQQNGQPKLMPFWLPIRWTEPGMAVEQVSRSVNDVKTIAGVSISHCCSESLLQRRAVASQPLLSKSQTPGPWSAAGSAEVFFVLRLVLTGTRT